MKKLTKEQVDAIKEFHPDWMKAVSQAKKSKAQIFLPLASFQDEPEGLYWCLYYATEKNILVTILPEE